MAQFRLVFGNLIKLERSRVLLFMLEMWPGCSEPASLKDAPHHGTWWAVVWAAGSNNCEK